MKIEVLFPEVCNLYGELGNIRYLEQSFPGVEVVETALNEEPIFVKEEPALIYMGTMTERAQLLVIQRLHKYKDRISQLIEEGAHFLITGNALEVFGKKIEDEDGTVTECLGLFDIVAKRNMIDRFNSLYLGSFDDMKIVGYKSQFAHSYHIGAKKEKGLFITERGPGLNPDIKEEGIRRNNFFATYIIGPILVLNPPFAKYMLKECGVATSLAFEQEAMEAYEARVAEYSEPDRGFYY